MLKIPQKIKKILWPYVHKKNSYSQSGEDLIVSSVFLNLFKIKKPSYLDIGAFHPYYLNNTAIFYKNGSRGINIEPNPANFALIKSSRKRDINLNFGIAENEGYKDFFIMSAPTLNTFSRKTAEDIQALGEYKIEKVIKIETFNINEIVRKYWHDEFPDFLSLDVEGYEMDVLKTIDYERKSLPKVICLETMSFVDGKKETEGIVFLEKMGYEVHADTYLNTIFVNKKLLSEKNY